jgi:hypothetical protein
VLDFLFDNPRGHCEFFASAMTLLGRVSGVPTRLVSGYRVAEQSPFGYGIVRRSHAHSWVEAWVDDEWQTFDPTPAAALGAGSEATTPWVSAWFDALATGWEKVDDWLERRTPLEFSLMVFALAAVFVLYRVLGQRRSGTLGARIERPLDGFLALETSLGRRGLPKAPYETLEAFAARIERSSELSEPLRADVAAQLRAYALLRYAGRGDERDVERALHGAARQL